MQITIIGAGYVGLVSGACLADIGNRVICVDIDKKKINKLRRGKSPIYEPKLDELLRKNIKIGNLFFSDDLAEAIKDAEIIFIAVGTPQGEQGMADLSYVYEVAKNIGKCLDHYAVIVNKSTVPIGTAKNVRDIISRYYKNDFAVASNPEFLREGSAIKDFMFPDRIVIGTDSKKAENIIKKLYQNFNCPKIFVNQESSEMIKYAANAFLATKISFINEIAGVCERINADIKDVAYGAGLDPRIGDKFLEAGLGYGGSCFPKDSRALYQIAKINGYEFKILKSVIEVNNNQKKIFIEKIKNVFHDLRGKTIAVWGLAFKPNTDDIRESPAMELIHYLLGAGVKIKACDPVAIKNAKTVLPKEIGFYACPYEAASNSDAVVVITDWDHFKKIDKKQLKSIMAGSHIFDGRNIFEPAEMKKIGFLYYGIGRTNIK